MFTFYVLLSLFVHCFSIFSSVFKKEKTVVYFPDPFTFLILCRHLQVFCVFLLPVTRTCCSFSEHSLQANGTHFVYRLREAGEPGICICLWWPLTDGWGGRLKALAARFSSGQDCSEANLTVQSSPREPAEATFWGTLITPLLLPLPSTFYFLHSLPVSVGGTFFINHLDTNPCLRSASENNLINDMGL